MVVQDIRAIWAPGQLSPKALAATLYKSKGDKGGHVCASPDKHPSITALSLYTVKDTLSSNVFHAPALWPELL